MKITRGYVEVVRTLKNKENKGILYSTLPSLIRLENGSIQRYEMSNHKEILLKDISQKSEIYGVHKIT